ncbi:MAG: Zn-dependent protease [Psychromonas sp.]|jgi:Zn-dependent protease|uniref:site-2 protease family protein n=1 Tax=Psychromonas sp. TaxID=1884585 RepID=UPI0039E3561B
MGLLSLLMQNPVTFLMLAIPLLYSIIFHEIAHGLVASWFGDNTARRSGRLTLNPIAHIDPIGTLMLLLIGFGWAKPVPVNFANLKPSRLGVICVALAGCTINICIAMAAILLMQFEVFSTSSIFSTVLPIVAKINIMLAAFNLIPIPPLDGSRVLMEFLPKQMQAPLVRIEPYGFFIILILLYTGVLYPVIDVVQNLIYSFISIFFA